MFYLGSLFIPFISAVIQKYPESKEHFKVIGRANFFCSDQLFLINAYYF